MITEQEIKKILEDNEQLRDENKKLKEENKEIRKIIDVIKKLTECNGEKKLIKIIKKLLNKIAFYESPNMPSSAPKLNTASSNKKEKKYRRKRGAQKGHDSATRKKPENVDEIQLIDLTNCPNCDTRLGDPVSLRTRIVEDIVFENLVKAVLYIILLYYCSNCKKIVSGIPQDVIPKMNLGTNVTMLTSFLKYKYRLTFNLIRNFFKDFYGFTASEGAYAYQIKKIAKILNKPYKDIEKEIRNSGSSNADETGEKWLGGKAWGWKFITKHVSLYKLERSRAHDILDKVFGKDYSGAIGCDGHPAYNMLKKAKRQRCWEHIWRPARQKIKEGKASKKLETFYYKLVHIIKLADNYKTKNYPFKNAEMVKERYKKMLGKHIEKFYRDHTIKQIIAAIHRYWNELFTFLDYKDLNYHNNDTERDIREEVIQRKISGGVKSDEGAECRSILRSVIRTYEKKGIDFMDEVKKLIVASNLAE